MLKSEFINMRSERFADLQQFNQVINNDQIGIIVTYLHQLEKHDNGTTLNHSIGVMKLATQLGILLGIEGDEFLLLQLSALLHDIGKLGVDPVILNKPAKPNPIELQILQTHPDIGSTIALYHKLPAPIPEVIHSHQRWYNRNGGYPKILLGNDPPHPFTQIVTICDALHVILTNNRPYQDGTVLTFDKAVTRLQENAGTQFDPQIVETIAFNTDFFKLQLLGLLSPIPFISPLSIPVPALLVTNK